MSRTLLLHLAVIAALFAASFLLAPYHHTNTARIMLLAVYAMGYNLAFGYSGMLSLGHAMFFGAGMYAAGLMMTGAGWPAAAALALGPLAGAALAALVGLLSLRTTGVSFMIVTLMFAQAAYLSVLYFTPYTRGEEGFVLPQALRQIAGIDLSADGPRYYAAWAIFSGALLGSYALIRSKRGRVMRAMRENEERSRMLGYNPFTEKLVILTISGAFAGLAGAAYGLLFGYVGASFVAIPFSILPLLWVLTGGAGTSLGPLIGVALMFYLVDIASSYTSAHQILVGAALVLLVLFAPQGILGGLRARYWRGLP